MRVAAMALVAVALVPGCRLAQRRSACADALPPGMRQDWHGRTYLTPDRVPPDALMLAPPAAVPPAGGATALNTPTP
jgi:hypothetical protein